MEQPLCPSLFPRVPPFIKFIPAINPDGTLEKGQQYWDRDNWDQERLWRIPMAMESWIQIWAQMSKPLDFHHPTRNTWHISKGECLTKDVSLRSSVIHATTIVNKDVIARRSRRSLALSRSFNLEPFTEKAEDAINFMDQHPGVKLIMFAKMHEIARKNILGERFFIMQTQFPKDFNIHPLTFSLPGQREALQIAMKKDPQGLWIIKPPNSNNGNGVRLITTFDPLPSGKTCVQSYIRDPFLIRGCKFDIRVYVLLTSLDPLLIYLYDDGLVRIATERYTENPRSAKNNWIHVTNAAVNQSNNEKYIFNDMPDQCFGHKWRLKCLWAYLSEHGLSQVELDLIWNRIEDAVIKTIFTSYHEMQAEYNRVTKESNYNSYKVLGFDLLLDRKLNIFVIEVNARPALLSQPLDQSVNRPMLQEMVNILGFRIPSKCNEHQNLIKERFPHCSKSQFFTFEWKIHCRILSNHDEHKQEMFLSLPRSEYLESILKDFPFQN
ncbi:tubulin monoglutamylase TTLL4-like isoform X2 [Tigriopus californicus]|uniref:tubulin monoglutamylase TTLL4-like isoform X2 n=1 Tax=Tigriopus californicus TaxID=6832 RepID=UPI0027DA24D9|nr:tubulin monoglutamylase TTLL4-like isoform X2 [Tigriopus californicus]